MKKQIKITIMLCISIAFYNYNELVGMAESDNEKKLAPIHIRIPRTHLKIQDDSPPPCDLELLVGSETQEKLTRKSFATLLQNTYGTLLAIVRSRHQEKNNYHVYNGPEFAKAFRKTSGPTSSNLIMHVLYYLTPSARHPFTPLGSCITYQGFFNNKMLNNAFNAVNGNRDALYELGLAYAMGTEGIPIDYQQAMEWYKKAADMDDARAMLDIGALYCRGLGTEVNYQKMIWWWEKAAQTGNIEASISLGVVYAGGFETTIEKDLQKARACYEKVRSCSYTPQSSYEKENLGYLAYAVQDVVLIKSATPVNGIAKRITAREKP